MASIFRQFTVYVDILYMHNSFGSVVLIDCLTITSRPAKASQENRLKE